MKKWLILCAILSLSLFPLWSRRNIMMTGYWAPTSEMIYQFSDDPLLNPDGWIGENWEDSGYDVYSFFPAFNRETRDFEVDYQATWEDFWATVNEYNPIAIISYGAGSGPWEIEYNARNLSNWIGDYEYPYQPTPCPPDSTVPANFMRHATLPVAEIEAAVDDQTYLNAWVDWDGDPGRFLCEYMAYLGMWYQNSHSNTCDEYPCLAAGFIHVNSGVNLGYATDAAQITLRTTIEFLHQFIDVQGTVIAEGVDPAGTEIILENENLDQFSAVADNNGEFSFPLLPSGYYNVTAFLDRYFFYDEEILIDSLNSEIIIELQDYPALEPLSWCSEPTHLINSAPGINIMVANVFEPIDLAPYADCHLRELYIHSAINEEDGDMELILYQGTPDSSQPMTILWQQELSAYSTGNDISVWLQDLDLLTDETFEQGLTLACQINSSTGDLAWMDDGPALAGKGNMINVSGVWLPADEMLEACGNWDLGLTFYGTSSNSDPENIASINSDLINYPNPFNPTTCFEFYAPQSKIAHISIYNIKGELVFQAPMLNNQNGSFTYYWKGINNKGKSAASGVYMAVSNSEQSSAMRKVLLIK